MHSTVEGTGRTLDVASTGEAGLDWSNMKGQTTTQNFTGTTIKNTTDLSQTASIIASTKTTFAPLQAAVEAACKQLQAAATSAGVSTDLGCRD